MNVLFSYLKREFVSFHVFLMFEKGLSEKSAECDNLFYLLSHQNN